MAGGFLGLAGVTSVRNAEEFQTELFAKRQSSTRAIAFAWDARASQTELQSLYSPYSVPIPVPIPVPI